ncbi:MAG: NAD(P)/FAD-dependent oxidoreductase [Anaerolineae bacterium]|nr:NAD(P)/FAD-dependent oxidoreductase [Anaerolineae bacterium]
MHTRSETPSAVDIAIIGGGAAGLMAAIWAGRTAPQQRIVVLDGAHKLGAKILIAGGGRCNVTHEHVRPDDFAGGSRNAIKNVLRRFDVPETVQFFAELGVTLKREETGKLFPTTDKARTILDALLNACAVAGVSIYPAHRIETIDKQADDFALCGPWGHMSAKRVVLATGGKSIPKTGSDGHGYTLAQRLGHSVTPRLLPALVPLLLPEGHFVHELSGVTLPTTLTVLSSSGKRLHSEAGSTLCTHFGLSGPAVLNVSRHYLSALAEDADVALAINWLPEMQAQTLDDLLQGIGRKTIYTTLRDLLPDRLACLLCEKCGVDPQTPGDQLTRVQRKALVTACTQHKLPISGNRGFNYAEVTAGGVPLDEIVLKTMASRPCSGLYLCGELLDVDGRIGGFNFQWAWASGYVAGIAVATVA